MNVESFTPDGAARRAFLERIEALLPGSGIAWASIEYCAIRPFGGIGLALTVPDMPGEAQVIAVVLYDKSAVGYARFPDNGTLAYQLLIKDAGSYSYFVEHCISPDPQAIIAALKVWATLNHAPQRPEMPSLSEHDLDPLRRLSIIRSTIVRQTQNALERGVERCSKTLEQELGLERAHDFYQAGASLTPTSQAALIDDLRHLAPDLLLSHFPRESDGRLLLGATILLARYDSTWAQSRDRQMWLCARAPQRRRAPQIVTLALASLIGVNHVHRWDQARWLWDNRLETATEEVRWGVAGLDCKMLGLEERDRHIAILTERCARPDSSLADRAGLCLLLQDTGRFEDAFALFGIEFTSDTLKILYNQPISLHTVSHISSWSEMLMSVLSQAAPWRFAALPAGTHHRICALPHQTQQRKTCLTLVTPGKRQRGVAPLFVLEDTASNKILPRTAWQRPLDLDLKRFQLL